MSVTLTGVGGLLTRVGDWAGEYNRAASLYGSALDAGFLSIWAQYGSTEQAAVQQLPDAVTSFRNSAITYQSVLAQDCATSWLLQVQRDTTVTPATLQRAVQIVYDQMVTNVQSINRPTITTAVAYGGTNLGNTKFFLSNTNIYGDPLDMTLAEVMTATCTSQGSGLSSTFQVHGAASVAVTAYNWPQGSGASTSITVVDPAIDGIVTNSSLSTFTVADTPDDFTIVNGAAGATVFEAVAGGVRTGSNAVYLRSDGAQATKIQQELSLQVNTAYAITFQAKMNTNSATGVLVVQFVDGSGTVIANDAAANLQASYNLNGGAGEITTSYQLLTVFFSTPRQLPSSGVFLRAGYGVAGVSTRQLYLCNLQVFQATPLYGAQGTGTSGPFAAGVANTVASAVGDGATFTLTSSLGTQSFVFGMERLMSFRNLGAYLPSSTSPTVPDNLVTH